MRSSSNLGERPPCQSLHGSAIIHHTTVVPSESDSIVYICRVIVHRSPPDLCALCSSLACARVAFLPQPMPKAECYGCLCRSRSIALRTRTCRSEPRHVVTWSYHFSAPLRSSSVPGKGSLLSARAPERVSSQAFVSPRRGTAKMILQTKRTT